MKSGDWLPTASPDALRLRARLLARARSFFAERGVLEVETPLLSAATVPDPNLHSLSASAPLLAASREVPPPGPPGSAPLFLQTSPELAMKRLLAAGLGPIYQLGRAFRDGEAGRLHNPEFTMLEWYRPGFDHHHLMDEVEELVRAVVGEERAGDEPFERLTYRDAFRRHAGVDPLTDPLPRLAEAAAEAMGGASRVPDLGEDRDGWLDLLMVSAVQQGLGRERGRETGRPRPTFLHDFPASQAALARVRSTPGEPAVAERFELFMDGMELANGFHELADAAEQRRRFEHDLELRRDRGLTEVPIDERLLAALEAGLPDCAGVALGFDRLVMVAAGARDISEVIAFPIDRA